MDEDLNDAAKQVEVCSLPISNFHFQVICLIGGCNSISVYIQEGMKAKMEGLLDDEFLQQYAIADKDAEFEKALQNGSGKIPSGGLISVKSSKTKPEKQKDSEKKSGKKRGKDDKSSKSKKKHKSKEWRRHQEQVIYKWYEYIIWYAVLKRVEALNFDYFS